MKTLVKVVDRCYCVVGALTVCCGMVALGVFGMNKTGNMPNSGLMLMGAATLVGAVLTAPVTIPLFCFAKITDKVFRLESLRHKGV